MGQGSEAIDEACAVRGIALTDNIDAASSNPADLKIFMWQPFCVSNTVKKKNGPNANG